MSSGRVPKTIIGSHSQNHNSAILVPVTKVMGHKPPARTERLSRFRQSAYTKHSLLALTVLLEICMEIRLNADGTLDKIVGEGQFHLEQMDRDIWFLEIDGVAMMLGTNTEAHITVTLRDYTAWSEAERILKGQSNKGRSD